MPKAIACPRDRGLPETRDEGFRERLKPSLCAAGVAFVACAVVMVGIYFGSLWEILPRRVFEVVFWPGTAVVADWLEHSGHSMADCGFVVILVVGPVVSSCWYCTIAAVLVGVSWLCFPRRIWRPRPPKPPFKVTGPQPRT